MTYQKYRKKIIAVGDHTLMKIDIDKQNERFMREMISKNSRYGSMSEIANEAIQTFYQNEKKRRFR